MWQGMRRRALAGIVVLAGLAVCAPAASASVTASMSVTSATPLAAGSSGNLGLDLKFTPSSSTGAYNDAPKSVTLNLPPGVLANASIDGGQCLKTADINGTTCQLGSGTVTAYAYGIVPIPTNVNFYLVPPPAPGDLAGLAVADTAGDQIGATNAIVIRPSGSPDGVGVTLDLTLPNSLDGTPIDVTEIDSTFTGTRFPATCPATPADITMSADSYNDATPVAASAPLPVSGCSSLAFNPKYSLSAVRDTTDKVVKISTSITQTATESPNSSVSLAFPYATLTPSLGGVKNLCTAGPASGKCKAVGSVTAQSPDYPSALTGQAYLTGSLSGLTLTLVFPAPFPLTLVGTVNLKTNVTTFHGLPDIPLTSLVVNLEGGKNGLFSTTCLKPSNTSTATLTDQNGDKTAKPVSAFTVQGCPSASNPGSSSGHAHHAKPGKAHVIGTRFRGLKTGKPSMRFTVVAGKHTKLKSFSVKLPKGLSFRTHRAHKKPTVAGLTLKHAKLKSEKATKGHLEITLRKAVKRVTVAVSHRGLKESKALRRHARAKGKKKLKHLKFTVVARTPKGRRTTIHVTAKHLGL